MSVSQPSWLPYAVASGAFAALNGVFAKLTTTALTSSCTVRVSVLNTSANFFVTAILGWGVFGEKLPALWWLGASLLVAGSVIIGRREESAEGRPEAKLAYEASEDVYSDGCNAALKEAAGAGSGIEPKGAASVRSRDLDRRLGDEKD
ncbi:hypothetical protein B0A48_16427 [Cryoendolithus antarcticus]|uniref:EamA domain-containing protein n=1 Tax=Cryoendolithus antarcticus TaxID=1507870 RepID=A0A1V8SE49_9PEZI|nr:hypothetical protein B0A48_16427 [Cryoendolithus antarcticus]